MKKLGRTGCIGRWKPLHLGGQALLEAICENADEVIIGVGSSNKYNSRNPFTSEESEEMINRVLKPRFSNYSIIHVPDFAHDPKYRDGQKWIDYVAEQFKKLDTFVSGNPYVSNLLKDTYKIIHPLEIIRQDKRIPIKASMIRVAMAKGEPWEDMVPQEVANYIKQNNLDDRFRGEFGLEVLAGMATFNYCTPENHTEEQIHTYER